MDILLERILSLIPKKENGDYVHGAKKEFAQKIGLKSGNVVSDWIAGRNRSYEDYDYKISSVFGVSLKWLHGETDDPTPPTVGRNYFIPPEVTDDSVSFPVIGEVAAGYKRLGFENWTGDSLEIPRSYLRGHNPQDYFVLRVTGNSMYPDYRDGDHVLVLRQKTLDYSGQIAVVLYDDAEYKDDGTLKKVEFVKDEWMKLSPLNLNEYSPVKFVGEDMLKCEIQGVAKMLIREID